MLPHYTLATLTLLLLAVRRVTVEPVVVEAGDVALGLPVALPPLRLCNTGTVEALFHFVPPPSGKAGALGKESGT